MIDKGDWWTAPTESDNGKLIMVTGRRDIEKFRSKPKYSIRVEITWRYEADASGMPDRVTSTLMEQVQDAMQTMFHKDHVAVMTGIYTGDGERNWVFYTHNTHIFEQKINQALAQFDLLPITIYTENDPEWAEYDEMKSATEIEPE